VAAESKPSRSPLSGVFPVLCTPFRETVESAAPGGVRSVVDLESLDPLVDFTLASGADGLTLGGVASEVHKLADEERRAIVERVLARVAGRAPVWVGTSHQSTELVLAHSLHAQSRGAAGVMVMPPFVSRPSLAALATFFRELDDALDVPVMIQDAPLFSGLHLPSEWLVEVAAKSRNVRAVKVEAPPTSPKIAQIARLAKADTKRRSGFELALFGGLGGANLVSELHHSASGTLPGSAYPELAVAIVAKFSAGDVEGAAELERAAAPLVRFVGQSVEWSYHAYKRVLVRRGVLKGASVRRPTIGFDSSSDAELDALWSDFEKKSLSR
jgi:4-hydroxy-tetrahydrodipicolinate synthase